jgi:hypothetical protein
MADTRGLVLGELAVREKLLTEVELDECVQQQIDERYRRPLGEIMIARGLIDQAGLDDLLARQRESIAAYEESAEFASLFGRIAVQKGFITEVQLAEALRTQIRRETRGRPAKIGQVMLELDLIDLQKFWRILHAQGDFVCGSCRRAMVNPWFQGDSVVCEHCKVPAFSISPEKPGPRPTSRRTKK